MGFSANNYNSDKNEKAATKIQTIFRGFIARKKYGIEQLDEKSQADYKAFFMGNDPEITELKPYQAVNGHTVLIATSGMRAILLACQLASNTPEIPKIILIDNSKQVYSLWCGIRKYIETCNNKQKFFKGLIGFLNLHDELYYTYADCNQWTIKQYFESLFNSYGYNRVKSIIITTVFIRQSWGNKKNFDTLKNVFSKLNIENVYVYASNILFCSVNRHSVDQILKNIAMINPKVSIHTDSCPVHRLPERVLVCQNSNPVIVKNTLFPDKPNKVTQRLNLEKILDRYRNHKFNLHSGGSRLLEEKENVSEYFFPASGLKVFKKISTVLEKEITDDIYIETFTSLNKTLSSKAKKNWGIFGWRARDQDTENFNKELINDIRNELSAFNVCPMQGL